MFPVQTKKERFHTLTEDLKKSSFTQNRAMVGKTFRVLVRGKERKGEFLSGLTEGRINIRIHTSDKALIGQIVNVNITAAAQFSVAGDLIKIQNS